MALRVAFMRLIVRLVCMCRIVQVCRIESCLYITGMSYRVMSLHYLVLVQVVCMCRMVQVCARDSMYVHEVVCMCRMVLVCPI